MNTIRLTNNGILWNCQFSEAGIRELFGTDTLPIPYKANMPSAEVLAIIRRLNPECRVIFSDC